MSDPNQDSGSIKIDKAGSVLDSSVSRTPVMLSLKQTKHHDSGTEKGAMLFLPPKSRKRNKSSDKKVKQEKGEATKMHNGTKEFTNRNSEKIGVGVFKKATPAHLILDDLSD